MATRAQLQAEIVRCHLNKYRYAAYGSNLHPLRLAKRVPSATHLGTSFLPSWKVDFCKRSYRDGTGKCTIARGGTGVYLAIFDIDCSERQDLDLCEGLGIGYKELTFDDPKFGNVVTYVADKGSIDGSLLPLDWYKEYVLLGCEYNGFPPDYVERFRAVPSCIDSDDTRSEAEWSVVEEIRNGT